jgi:Rad3-related DNA helicase
VAWAIFDLVLESCKKQQNSLLESPTGTGKTLSLLCGSLAWLKEERRKKNPDVEYTKILYCSRTHSQLNQVIKELKSTVYNPKTVLLGSRDQMCVNPKLKEFKGSGLNAK